MKLHTSCLIATVALAALAGCAGPSKPAVVYNDGEIPLPAGYTKWARFLPPVQRPDAKQVREIYMNDTAKAGTAAGGFPNGTVFVMENYAAEANADGSLKAGPDGKLVKGSLLRVFVMGKDAGWGQAAPEALRNGNWVYASYLADGKKGPEDTNSCRGCHLPHAAKDFVLRYDEHFQQRGSTTQYTLVAPLRQGAGAAGSAPPQPRPIP